MAAGMQSGGSVSSDTYSDSRNWLLLPAWAGT